MGRTTKKKDYARQRSTSAERGAPQTQEGELGYVPNTIGTVNEHMDSEEDELGDKQEEVNQEEDLNAAMANASKQTNPLANVQAPGFNLKFDFEPPKTKKVPLDQFMGYAASKKQLLYLLEVKGKQRKLS